MNREYLDLKCMYSYIFSNDISLVLDSLKDISTLKIFLNAVRNLTQENSLSKERKEYIFKILYYLREVDDLNKIERSNIINEIIRTINLQIFDDSDIFYRTQLVNRFCNNKYYSDKYDISDSIDDIELSIVFDYYILKTHLDSNNLLNEYMDLFLNNQYTYILSLSYIIAEDKYIINDKTFLNNCLTVLFKIKDNSDFITKINCNKFIKLLKKGVNR